MRYFYILISLFIFTNTTSAQQWKAMMHDPQVNVYMVVQEAEAFFKNVDKTAKGSGWKSYQRWLHDTEPKYYPNGDRSNSDPYFVQHAAQNFTTNNTINTQSIFTSGWEELGPYYLEQITGHYSAGLGRIETFYADPNDSLKIYLGSRSGGFWKSIDGGTTWTGGSTDTLFAAGVNTLTVRPTHTDSILINVRNSQNGASHGIYRSVDGGEHWSLTNFNPTNLLWGGLGTSQSIYTIAYHPTVSNLVFVGTQEGLYRSANDLNTWTQAVANYDFTGIAFHPTNSNIIYAVASNNDSQVYRSTDGGISFTTSTNLTGNFSNLRISVSNACANCVYLASSDGIWKSADEGATFSLLSNPAISNYGAFSVSDIDTNVMLVGDIDVHTSLDEGANFNQATYWSQGNANYNTTGTYVHADIRGAKAQNGKFWVNTDGLLANSSDNGVTWQIFEGQSIRENYNLGVSQSNHHRTICGSQDNGTSIKTESSWIEFYGADGMEGIIHPLNDDWMIGSLQFGGRRRTTDGGLTQTGATPSGQTGGWIAPLVYDPNNQMTVYHFGDTLYKSTNFGSSWVKLGSPSFSGTIDHATIAQNNTNIIVATKGRYIERSLDGGNTFSSIQGSLPNAYITDVVFHPNNDSVILVTFGRHQNDNNKVFISSNMGATWTNITYNLGNLPVRSAVIDHTNNATIYLGTEIGVYKKSMSGNQWSLYNPNLPNMSVRELEIVNGSNTLRAATWGRGLWEYTLDGRQDYPSILTTQNTQLPDEEFPLVDVDQWITSVISYSNTLSSVFVKWSVNTPSFNHSITMNNTVDSTWVSSTAIPHQPAGTKVFFKVFAVGANADTTETYKFMYETRPATNCISYGSMAFNTAVTLVDFHTINNATGKTQPYTNYISSHIDTLELNNTYNITVNVNTDGNYTNHTRVWFDWNHDGDYSDPNEMYELGTASNTANGPTNLSPLSITIPLTASLGQTTMRVSTRYNTAPDSCLAGFDGEVEDYGIYIDKIRYRDSSMLQLCQVDSVFLAGAWQNTTGIYIDTVPLSAIADSIYTVNLTVLPATPTTIIDTSACGSFAWDLANTSYTSSGVYTHTASTVNGCDSVVQLQLTVFPITMTFDTVIACDFFTWPATGATLTASGTYLANLGSSAGCDSTIQLQLILNGSSQSDTVIAACSSYFWKASQMQYTQSGVYTHTTNNSTGCDSTMTLHLTIDTINMGITQQNNTLTAVQTNATYQWINCDSLTPVLNETNASFTPSLNGKYAVEINANSCIDTSICYTVSNVGVIENSFKTNIDVYPNPTKGNFSIALNGNFQEITVNITNMAGQHISTQRFENQNLLPINLQAANGSYLLTITSGNQKAVFKIIKKE